MADTITLHRFDDMHVHLRTDAILKTVLPFTTSYAARVIIMPNTRPRAILCADDVIWYRDAIYHAIDELFTDGVLTEHPDFEPLMTIEIRDSTTPEMVAAARRVGAVAGKVYPLGVTTNADEGLRFFFEPKILDTFRAMRDVRMPLLIHGELDRARTTVMAREEAFLPTLPRLAEAIPDLKIVLEHVSTREGVMLINGLGANVAATITAHHLRLTINDVIGDGIRPHQMCMPVPKGFDDRDALIEAATSGNPKFFLGSDSAPHVRGKKECAKGACGVFSSPTLPETLAEKFEEVGRLDRLDDFASRFGAAVYGLPRNEGVITLERRERTVPGEIGGIVPFRAGEALRWSLVA